MTTTNKKPKGNGEKEAIPNVQPSLQLLPLIMHNIPQAVFWKDRDLVYLGCNRAFAEDAGLASPEEVVGKTDFDMPWKDQAELYRGDDCLVMEKGQPKLNYEEPQTTPDGSTIWLRTSKIPVQEGGKIVAVLGMYEDITEYKKAQQANQDERQRFQTILETIRIPTIISRLSDGQVLYANQAIAQISQVNLDKLIGFKTGNFYANPDDQEKIREALRASGYIDDFEVQFRRTDGSTYWALLSSRIINYEGETCVLSSYVDITARKQAEQALRESQQFLQTVMDNIPQSIFWKDSNLTYLGCNSAFADDAGLASPSDALGKTDRDMPWKEQAELYRADDSLVMKNGTSKLNYEEPQTTPDGSTIWLRTSKVPLHDSEGTIFAVLGMYEDITARKQVETALKAHDEFSQKQASAFAELARSEKLYGGDVQAAFAEVTEAAAKTLGVQRASIWYYNDARTEIRCMDLFEQGKGHSEGIVLSKNDFPSYFKALEDEKVIAADNAHTDPATREFSAAYLTPLGINSMLDAPIRLRGRVIGVICNEHVGPFRQWTMEEQNFARTIVDFVTVAVETQERKQAESLLQQSETNLLSALRVANMGHWEYDIATQMFTLNDQYYSLHGMTAQQAGGYQISLQRFAQEFVWPEDGPIVGQATQQAIETTDPDFHVDVEARIMHADGKPRWVTVWFRIEKDAQGNTVKLHGVNQDINERKQVEQALRDSEARYSAVVTQAKDGVVIIQDNILQFVNDAMADMMGYTAAEMVNTPIINYIAAESRELIVNRIKARLAGQEVPAIYEAKLQRKDGTLIDAELSAGVIEYRGRPADVGMIRDITERKQAEEATKKSEENFRAIADFTYGWETWLSAEGKFLYVSPACERISEYAPNAFIENPGLFGEIAHSEDRHLVENHLHDHRSTSDTKPIEFRIITKSGKVRWISHACQAIYDSTGTWQGRRGSNLDITERKQAEQALRESQQFLQTVMDNIPQSIFWKDSNLTYLGCNSAFADDAGLASPSDALGKTDRDMPWKEQAELYRADDSLVMKNGTSKLNYEEPQTTPDGSTIWLRTSKVPLHDSEGTIFAVLGMYEDITARKQVETALKAHDEFSQKQASAFAELARSEKLYGGDVQAAFAEVTEAAAKTLGVQRTSIWYYNEDRTEIRCMDLFEQGKGHSEGIVLSKNDFPSYFKALEDEKVIAADNAHTDPATREFSAAYLTPLGINSMLDAPIRLRGRVIGVICNEHVGPFRQWTMEEQNFAGSIVDFVTVAVETQERKRLEQQIQTALERRGLQVQLSTKVSQSIGAASSLEELYPRVVTQVKEQFDYYHTQILRHDAAQEAVVLVSGYGEVGAKMLAAGHRLPLGEGLIGAAAATGETVLRPVLENDPDWHPNPLLPETKGEIAVPIKLGNNILGVLDVQSNAAGALDADDQLLLEGLCGQIAVAIESTRLRQEMTERLEEINRLYRAMSHEGWQTYRATTDLPSGLMFDQGGLRPVQDTGLAEELFASVPLTVPGGEVIGTLAIADDPQRPISPEDEAFLQQVSEQVALALESARLFEQTQSALSEVERRASELETVAKVSTTASTVLDPDQLLQSVVNLTKERFGLYHAHIYLVNPEGNDLILTAGAGEIGKQMMAEGWSIPVDHELSIIADAYRRRQSVVANDVHHDKESAFLSNRLLPNTRSEMALPLIVGDRVLGVFDVQSEEVNYFTAEDVNIYTTLASQVAVALQNARLYVEQAALVTQLRELDKLKSSFLANMSHELRTPLNSILGFADVIIEELDGPLTENMNNDLRLIQKNGQHLLHLINDVLDMAKIEAGRMNLNPETFTAFEVLEEVTSITSTLASEKNLSLFIEESSDQEVQIYADRTRLRQVMINLVNNAIKFTETGNISLKVASIPGARILITVKDTGIGIAADKLEPIFQEFTQVDASSTRKAGGTGLGLPISRQLVAMHGGRLWAESTGIPGEGSTFFVELPVEARITETVEKQVK